jgi:hypothetical protein
MDNSINGLDIEDSTANVTDLEVGGLANFNGDATFNINADFNGSVVVGSDTYSGGAVEADNSSINPTLRVTNWSGGNDRIDSNVIYADNSSTWSATMVVSNDASYTAVYVPAGSIETGTGFISSGDYVYATNYLETTGDATIGRTLKAGSTTYNGGAIQADNSSASPTIDASNAGAGSTIVVSNSDANFEAISASNTTGGKAIYVPQGSIDTYSGDINSGGQIYASGRLWSGQDTTVGTYLKVWESATVGTDTYPNTTITADNSSASPTIDASNAGAGSTIVVSNSDANFEAISASNTTGGWAIRVPEGSIETVAGSISSGSHVYATSYLHSGGDTTVGQALQVYGPAKISNDVSVTGNLWIGTDASVAGAIRSNGHINSVSGNITADAGGLYANGGAIVAQGVSSYIYSDYYIAAGTDLESTRDTTVGRYLKLSIANLPTSNPGVQGMVWRDGTNLCISL